MDITLLLKFKYKIFFLWISFNPCFNGYYTSTIFWFYHGLLRRFVSILVLMDITLLPSCWERILVLAKIVSILVLMDITLLRMNLRRCKKWVYIVSILVLMDITLLPITVTEKLNGEVSFNPCFNGYYTSTL